MANLTWSLVVATLNREECLLRSLRANIHQTRPPRQVVVVDSSADWERVRGRVLSELATGPDAPPGIDWTYVGTDQRSLTRQRNQGLAHADADIVFLLDDDSFMYHDCAEQILRIYEADTGRAIGGVSAALAAGHEPGSPAAASAPPADAAGDDDVAGNDSIGANGNSVAGSLLEAFHSLWYQHQLFIPYDGQFYDRRLAWLPADLAYSVPLFHGCRMTFRTACVREAGGFEDMLIRSCSGEDIDFSYRVSRRHALVVARHARLHHEQTPIARTKRSLNTTMVLLNAVALYQLNGARSPGAGRGAAYRFLLKRAALELVRDCARPRRGMPHFRGALRAARAAKRVLSLDADTLRKEYVDIQADLFKRG